MSSLQKVELLNLLIELLVLLESMQRCNRCRVYNQEQQGYHLSLGFPYFWLILGMQKVLHKPCFLDSQDLSSLHQLFTHGLLWSDTLVLLATQHVLTRPWCLLEVHEAAISNVPIIVMSIHGRGFDFDEAIASVNALETTLEPAALAEVRKAVLTAARLA